MPAEPRGSVYQDPRRRGIRWPEDGKRPQKTGFATKTEARSWFDENVAPRLRDGRPPEITFDAFCDLYLERHGATVAPRTRETLAERLAPRASVRRLDAARAGGRRRRHRRSGGRARRHVPLPADARDAAGARTPPCAGATSSATRSPTQARTRSRGRRSCCRSRATRSTRSPRSSAASTGRSSSSPPRPGSARTSGSRSSAATSTGRAGPSPFSGGSPTASSPPTRRPSARAGASR